MSKATAEGPVVGAVVNAVAILRHLGAKPEPAGVNAIARAVGISPSTCFNILKTLVREDLVEFDPQTKTYRFGAGLAALAQQTADGAGALPLASPLMEDLAERHGATIALWRLTASERLVLLGFAECAQSTRIHMTVGLRLPMLAGAGGRSVAATLDLPDAVMASEFRKLRWQNAPTLEVFREQVAEARRRGWALDDGDFLYGVTSLAAPVTDAKGAPRHIVTATLFRGQRPPDALARMGEDLVRCAASLGQRLGL